MCLQDVFNFFHKDFLSHKKESYPEGFLFDRNFLSNKKDCRRKIFPYDSPLYTLYDFLSFYRTCSQSIYNLVTKAAIYHNRRYNRNDDCCKHLYIVRVVRSYKLGQ